MSKEYLMSLAKLIVLMAWADGEIHKDERRIIDSLLEEFPELGDEEHAILRLYMEYELGSGEQRAILNEFFALCKTKEERDFAMRLLNKVAKADGTVDERERKIYQFIDTETKKNTKFLAKLKKKQIPISATKGRERDLKSYLENPIYFLLKKKAESIEMNEIGNLSQLKSLTIFAGIVSAVIQSDDDVSPDECALLKAQLEKHWHISSPLAWRLVDVILKHEVEEDELERYCNSFNDLHSSEDILDLFTVLVEIVKSDGLIHAAEQKILRQIAGNLGIDEKTSKELIPARKLDLSKLKKSS